MPGRGKIVGQHDDRRIVGKLFQERRSNSSETSADTIVDYLGSEEKRLQITLVLTYQRIISAYSPFVFIIIVRWWPDYLWQIGGRNCQSSTEI
jgi:hypothetical protein